MARKGGLGKGLDALIPTGTGEEGAGGVPPTDGVALISVELISPGKYQPRIRFEQNALEELAKSIEAQGVLQPLIVRPRTGGRFELIAGERRLRAAKLAGLSEVPAIVREVDDRSALELSIVENIQREDLDPLEEAEGYKRLIAEFGYTQEALGDRVGKDRATVTNVLRLLKLPAVVQDDIREGRLSKGHALVLMMVDTEEAQLALHKAIIEEGLTVRETENRAKSKVVKRGRPKRLDTAKADVYIKDMEESMVRALGTKVNVRVKGKGGKIEIEFFSPDELDRIYRRLLG